MLRRDASRYELTFTTPVRGYRYMTSIPESHLTEFSGLFKSLMMPASRDPLSPFNWAGKMWTATNSGTFSVNHNDNTFSAQGTFSSDFLPAGNFGEMGTERNGSFVEHEDEENDAEANRQELRAQKALNSAATSDAPNAGETLAAALRSSRARALRAWRSKP